MIRYLSTLRLKPGFDPEETYRLWEEVHVPWVKKEAAGLLKRYVISRIVSVFEGEPEFFGMAQLWFDDLDTGRRVMNQMLGSPPDEFMVRVTDRRAVFVVEEKEMEL